MTTSVPDTPIHPGATTSGAAQVGVAARLVAGLELGLLLLVVQRFGIEAERGLLRLAPLVFAGFLVHAWLPAPMQWRFFALLSLASPFIVFEPAQAAALVGIGLGLIGICWLPVPWAVRIVLLLAAGGALTGVRAEWIEARWARPVLPILGSMFMFRLVLYVYELRTDPRRPTIWQTLAYFFMLPNALFALFPIVDLKAFRRGHGAREQHLVHAKGLAWMLRGVVHLLLYRIVYQHFTPPAEAVHDLASLALYMVSGYALYLRVSGLFHLVVGMLCLFGFDLPETHHHYFLASGFNDLWRRINIYWKDFMMKIVYYPVFIRVRRRAPALALPAATVLVFLVSWWLHSYQWFWIRGSFPLTAVDAIFWTLFAAAVLVNSMLQARRGPAGRRRGGAPSPRAALVHALEVAGMFAFMCVLWTFWTGGSIDAFAGLLVAAAGSPAAQYGWLAAGLLGAVALGVVFQVAVQQPVQRWQRAQPPARAAAARIAVMLALLAVATPATWGGAAPPLVASILGDRLNESDQERLLRGYYEEVLDGDRMLGGLWEAAAGRPDDWVQLGETDAVRISPGTLHERELVPGTRLEFHGSTLTVNRWGMRDRDYELAKPPGTCRLALLGASIEMGSGVGDDEVFEALTEEQLRLANRGGRYDRHELLNFAVAGLSPLAQVEVFERKVLPFEPDVALFFAHTVDARLLSSHVRRLGANRVEAPDAELAALFEEAAALPDDDSQPTRLARWRNQKAMLRHIYARAVATCREHGVRPVWVHLPYPPDESAARSDRGGQLEELAAQAGFTTLRLDGEHIAPGGDVAPIVLRPWDDHPNAEGHRRIARELFRQLLRHDEALGLGLLPPGAPGAGAGPDAVADEEDA